MKPTNSLDAPPAATVTAHPNSKTKAGAAPAISAVVATRNRGARIVATIESLLASTHPNFEVIVVDQSSNDETQRALDPFSGDRRLRLYHSHKAGVSRSRNLGMQLARAAVVAITDDDCVVPPNWMEVFDHVFRRHPRVAVAYSNVVPAPHDPERGFVPAYARASDRLTRSLRRTPFTVGIGASMALRRDAVLAFGGFDPALGPGGIFPAAEDRDIAARALIKGWYIYETAKVAVVHDGFRTWEEGKELTERDWLGLGASWAKVLKSGHPEILSFLLYTALIAGFLEPLAGVIRLARPRFLKRQYYFWGGFVQGLRTAVEPTSVRFALPDDGG